MEVPPGPPVLATITAEVYGPADSDYAGLIQAAEIVRDGWQREPGIVDVDLSTESDQVRWVFETDKPKAALSGITTARHCSHIANGAGRRSLGGDAKSA